MVTAFQRKVYEATRRIPRGKVSTYGLVARSIGCASAQAVGQAHRRNPYAPRVPCHRVIASNLTLGGFAGRTEGPRLGDKRRLLAREGVVFRGGVLADPAQLFTFTTTACCERMR